MRRNRRNLAACAVLLAGATTGCGGSSTRVAAPSWDADAFAEAVFARLDANQDATLSREEAAASPGLAWGFDRADADQNGALSVEELVSRFELYEERRLGLTVQDFQVSWNGRPLPEGKVQFVPEFFLEGVVETAVGDVLPDGSVGPSLPGASVPGMRPGYYRVLVESPRAKLPPAYATFDATPLGVEVAPAATDRQSYGVIQLNLQDRKR